MIIISDRDKALVEARDVEHLTFRELGSRFGVCLQRATQIYHRTTHLLARNSQDIDVVEGSRLSIRAVNCLINAGLRNATRRQVRTWLKYQPHQLLQTKNLGHKTAAEIRAWVAE